jgi:hypothetical protein
MLSPTVCVIDSMIGGVVVGITVSTEALIVCVNTGVLLISTGDETGVRTTVSAVVLLVSNCVKTGVLLSNFDVSDVKDGATVGIIDVVKRIPVVLVTSELSNESEEIVVSDIDGTTVTKLLVSSDTVGDNLKVSNVTGVLLIRTDDDPSGVEVIVGSTVIPLDTSMEVGRLGESVPVKMTVLVPLVKFRENLLENSILENILESLSVVGTMLIGLLIALEVVDWMSIVVEKLICDVNIELSSSEKFKEGLGVAATVGVLR